MVSDPGYHIKGMKKSNNFKLKKFLNIGYLTISKLIGGWKGKVWLRSSWSLFLSPNHSNSIHIIWNFLLRSFSPQDLNILFWLEKSSGNEIIFEICQRINLFLAVFNLALWFKHPFKKIKFTYLINWIDNGKKIKLFHTQYKWMIFKNCKLIDWGEPI